MGVGRPPFYDNVDDLKEMIRLYFISLKGEYDPSQQIWVTPPSYPTITGLALYLGFTSRQAILNYEEKPEFVDAIKEAKLRVEAAYEQALFGKNAAGPIFALKNFNWTDKQEIDQKTEHSGSIDITWQEPPVSNPDNKGSD
jgi:hypothetical protein